MSRIPVDHRACEPRPTPATSLFESLESRLMLSATITNPIADLAVPQNSGEQAIQLADHFADDAIPDKVGTVVLIETVEGNVHVGMYDQITPNTVANFLALALGGSWDGMFFHRSLPGFVFQGGGFVWPSGGSLTQAPSFGSIDNEFANHAFVSGDDAQVTNGSSVVQLPADTDLSEVVRGDRIRLIGRDDGLIIGLDATDFFSITGVDDANDTVTVTSGMTGVSASGIEWFITHDVNVRGTLAMAKVGGDPDSASNGWFFNFANNAPNLDIQNGGFTTFAEVLFDAMTVVDGFGSLGRVNAGSPFDNLPVRDSFDPNSGSVFQEDLVFQTGVTVVQTLTYQVTGNTNPGLVTANIVDGELVVAFAADQSGSAEITVETTDLQGNTVSDTFEATVEPDAMPGDANGDGQVDGNDLIAVEENFGASGPGPLAGDANGDGQVDGNDLISVEECFGATNVAAMTVALNYDVADQTQTPTAASVMALSGTDSTVDVVSMDTGDAMSNQTKVPASPAATSPRTAPATKPQATSSPHRYALGSPNGEADQGVAATTAQRSGIRPADLISPNRSVLPQPQSPIPTAWWTDDQIDLLALVDQRVI